jgi:Fe-S oxidoreductase
MSGQLGLAGLADPAVGEVLDLCLSCKACKQECPSNVDLARLKSEWLQAWHERHGATPGESITRSAPALAARLAGPLAPLANALSRWRPVKTAMEVIYGFDARRTPPAYARDPFPKWFARRPAAPNKPDRQVVLFDDTWLNYHDTGVGIAAVELLESCGYEVLLARAGCCQRPAISKGFLEIARREGERTLRRLDPWLTAGVPIVCCEPSCCSALTDDLPDLIADEELGQRAAAGVMMIDVFLHRERQAGRLSGRLTSPARRILLHGHCHQKALYGTAAMRALLAEAPGCEVIEADAGCCGMAGAFGYEHEHYDLSVRIGEDRLAPAVRAAGPDATVVACGFSCRHQIADLTGVRARHFVEVLRGKIDD